MSSTMDENRQKKKCLALEHKALKWVKMNNAPPRITLTKPHDKWDDYDITFTITMIVKQEKLKCIECTNKRDIVV